MNEAAPTKRDAQASRRKILKAARAEFSQCGLDGARTSRIAKRAGVPNGLLYHYFESKDSLLDAALDDALDPFYREVATLVEDAEGRDSGVLLGESIRMYFNYLRDNPEVPALMAWWTASRRWEVNPEAKWMEASSRLRARAAELVQSGQEYGVIRKDLDPRNLVRMPFDLCLYWHQYWGWTAQERGIDLADEAAVEALHAERLKHIVELTLSGMLSEQAKEMRRY